jgi:BirA family transcriptional regulator, biotin operon repressor / biotin---[acetyl-CoA-carboxylase] ligase
MKSPDAALLRALRGATIHTPPTELAAQIGSTRAAVAMQIAELREAGFEIDERPGLGYRLITAPDRLIAADLHSRLGNCALVREIVAFEETDSTNDQAASLAKNGAAGGLVVFAEKQNAGRGRFGRRWESASHLGLWFSLLLRPTFSQEHWPRLTTWAAVSIASAIERATGVRTGIKWPNDIFVDGRKIAGVLIETGVDRSQQNFAVVGIGLNANHAREDFPENLTAIATSLRIATGRAIDRAAMVAAILRELDARFIGMDRRFHELIAEATRRSVLFGRWVQVRAGESIVEGVAESLDANGQLLLRTGDGVLHTLSAGEVTIAGGAVSSS